MVIDNVSDTWHKKHNATGRQIEEVAKVLCELHTEKMRRGGINVAIHDTRVGGVYEGSYLFLFQ